MYFIPDPIIDFASTKFKLSLAKDRKVIYPIIYQIDFVGTYYYQVCEICNDRFYLS